MGHHSCCNQQKVKRGLWSPEEDEKLIRYITAHGYGCWSEVPEKAGLQRCGKSCRLRWINYLRPDIRRGRFTPEEEKLIINLHDVVGNRWAHIASHLPGRTDNEIKNYWNSWIKKKIRKPSFLSKSTCSTNVAATAQSNIDHISSFNYNNSNHHQLDHHINSFANQVQDHNIITSKPTPLQETLFSPTCPMFMLDTSSLDNIVTPITNDNAIRAEQFNEGTFGLSSETWNLMSQNHQVQALTSVGFDTSHNYLPPLIENVENMVPIEEEGDIASLECLQGHELNEWVETHQSNNLVFWEGHLGGEELAPNSSSNMEPNTLSPFPSSL